MKFLDYTLFARPYLGEADIDFFEMGILRGLSCGRKGDRVGYLSLLCVNSSDLSGIQTYLAMVAADVWPMSCM